MPCFIAPVKSTARAKRSLPDEPDSVLVEYSLVDEYLAQHQGEENTRRTLNERLKHQVALMIWPASSRR